MAKYIAKDSIIGLKELRNNADKYIAAVGKGKRFTVFKHSKPVFAIVPAEELEYDLEELDGPGWKNLDLTKIRKGGIPAAELLAIVQKFNRDNE